MDKILVVDFGGQYNQLIVRRVRAEQVYAEIVSHSKITPAQIKEAGYKGIIFTGGPNSVYEKNAPRFDAKVLELGIPILGICYGFQLLAHLAGGEITLAESCSEYGKTELLIQDSILFDGIPDKSICWMSHADYVKSPPKGFKVIAKTESCPCAAISDDERKLYGVQFHPEVAHTVCGRQILRNFLFKICGCNAEWKPENFADISIRKLKAQLAGKKVLLALSGGVDSSVAAVLLHRAVGKNLACVFVDHGLLRKGEGDYVENVLGRQFGVNLIRVNAQDRFLSRLSGITDPESKRKIIGEEFIRVFEDEAKRIGDIDVLAQGTIYPDVIESGKGDSAVIKSHHNVGGLPEIMSFKEIVEPLRDLFKDEVREVGLQLGIPRELVWRQPFPGPGLAVRIIGEVTKDKLNLLSEADAIFREEIENAEQKINVSQYFAVLADLRSVGVMGDSRTYGYTVILRAVTTDDFMTAEWARLPYEVLQRAGSRITNQVKGITRVVYDITSKPPATVEWE